MTISKADRDAIYADVGVVLDKYVVESPPVDPPPVTALRQYILGDGADGATPVCWNLALDLFWQNRGGDWLDANGIMQGTSPFARATVKTVPALVKLDATALLRKQIASGDNRGFLLRAPSGNSALCTRHEADTTKQPYVVVTRPDGSPLTLLCTADAPLPVGQELPVPQLATMSVGPASSIALQFDYAGISLADIASAELRLYAPQYAGANLELYELRPPRIWTGDEPGDMDTAQTFAPPDIHEHDWDPAKWQFDGSYPLYDGLRYFYEPRFFTDPILGRAVEAKLDPTIGNGECLVTIDPMFSAGQIGTSRVAPEQIYSLATIRLNKDFPPRGGPAGFHGKIPPCVAGRYGAPQANGSYWAVAANGQDATDGRRHYVNEPGGSPAWGGHSVDGTVLLGWSARGGFGVKPLPDNPYPDLVAVYSYVYCKNKRYTSTWTREGMMYRWGNVCLKKDRAYTLMVGVGMNSIDLSAPDALGNGVGRDDGWLRAFVDGVEHPVLDFHYEAIAGHKAQPKPITGMNWRDHPDIKCDEPEWVALYFGGMPDKAVWLATDGGPSHVEFGRVACSTQPIGKVRP